MANPASNCSITFSCASISQYIRINCREESITREVFSDLLSLVQTCVASSFVLVFGAATALLTTPSITCTGRFIDDFYAGLL